VKDRFTLEGNTWLVSGAYRVHSNKIPPGRRVWISPKSIRRINVPAKEKRSQEEASRSKKKIRKNGFVSGKKGYPTAEFPERGGSLCSKHLQNGIMTHICQHTWKKKGKWKN